MSNLYFFAFGGGFNEWTLLAWSCHRLEFPLQVKAQGHWWARCLCTKGHLNLAPSPNELAVYLHHLPAYLIVPSTFSYAPDLCYATTHSLSRKLTISLVARKEGCEQSWLHTPLVGAFMAQVLSLLVSKIDAQDTVHSEPFCLAVILCLNSLYAWFVTQILIVLGSTCWCLYISGLGPLFAKTFDFSGADLTKY
jgi:hypothetical protein